MMLIDQYEILDEREILSIFLTKKTPGKCKKQSIKFFGKNQKTPGVITLVCYCNRHFDNLG